MSTGPALRKFLMSEPPLTDDELIAIRQLIEERFPLASAAPVQAPAPGPADSPASESFGQKAGAGHPNLTAADLINAAEAIRDVSAYNTRLTQSQWLSLALKLYAAAKTAQQTP